MKNIAIEVKNISKTFKKVKAVNNLSFIVTKSTCFGILGPNGAGKTTMMKMLYGKANREINGNSKVNIFGFDPLHNSLEIKYISGIVPQENNLDLELTVIQNLIIYSKFYGISKKVAYEKVLELLKFMELSDKKDSKIRTLSGGMKRRLVIARSLLNEPKLLILDEPTTGLDPQVRHLIWDKLHHLKSKGVTLLLTTHYMEEASQLCDNLIIMNLGKKVIEGSPKGLIEKNMEKYVLEINNLKEGEKLIKNDLTRIEKTSHRILLFSNKFEQLENISKSLISSSYYLRQSNLEDVFLKITGKSFNE